MRDYTEQVKAMRVSAEWLERLAELKHENDGSPYAPMILDAADAIEELLAAVPKWNPVSEPPKEKGEYIVAYYPCYWDDVDYSSLEVGIDTFLGKTSWAKRKYQRVTHWMYKPNLPEEGNQ